MDVLLHRHAEKFLESLEKKIQLNVRKHLKLLSENPYSNQLDIKKLKGLANKPDLFRLRVGDYRIIYCLKEDKIWVTEIMKRGHGYEDII